jgi:hypothetical protein
MLPEQYQKRYPGAETYTETLAEEESVLGTFATILSEGSKSMHAPSDLARLVTIKKAGYLVPFILASSGKRFAKKEGEEFQEKNPEAHGGISNVGCQEQDLAGPDPSALRSALDGRILVTQDGRSSSRC